MKICIYSGTIPAPQFIENLISGLARADVEVFCFGKGNFNQPAPSNVTNLILNTNGFIFRVQIFVLLFRSSFINYRNLRRCLKILSVYKKFSFQWFNQLGFYLPILIHKPDIIHIQWAKTLQLYPELCDILEQPIIVSLRGSHINYSPLADKSLAEVYKTSFPRVAKLHAVSYELKCKALQFGDFDDRVEVIYSILNSGSSIVKRKVESNELNVISVGRFHWIKGYKFALEAIRQLLDQHPNLIIKYSIIAEGTVPEEILFLLEYFNLQRIVEIFPKLSHEEVLLRISSSDILILPSIDEGIANVVLEAMMVDTIVLSSNCGGMSEVIKDGVNGFLFEVRNSGELAQKIQTISLLSSEKKQEILSQARETLRLKFDPQEQVEKFIRMYSSCMSL
jgi:glycosyltransferase involved in cell wall biosynthesis